MLLKQCQGLHAVGGLQHAEPGGGQHIVQQAAVVGQIVHHQHAHGCAAGGQSGVGQVVGQGARVQRLGGLHAGQGQLHMEAGALAGCAAQLDGAAHQVQQALADAQAQPGAPARFAPGFRLLERLEQQCLVGLADAGAGVFHLQPHLGRLAVQAA